MLDKIKRFWNKLKSNKVVIVIVSIISTLGVIILTLFKLGLGGSFLLKTRKEREFEKKVDSAKEDNKKLEVEIKDSQESAKEIGEKTDKQLNKNDVRKKERKNIMDKYYKEVK